ncbi:limonene-1%2C2-epoxide hydrolase [Mycobacterium tuberculosis]|nr:limonene-1%2C2-epoxide hydrolase [Mycobacterium tuberculosis]
MELRPPYAANRVRQRLVAHPHRIGYLNPPAAALARHPVGHPPQIPATERTETPTFGPLRIRFWACGIFEVQRARYGITTSASKALVRGLTASAFSSPRATL